MTPSAKCVALTKQSEGLRLKVYKDDEGFDTIGRGHKLLPGEPRGPITEEYADGLMLADLSLAGSHVERLVKVPLTQGQYDALTDFCFNLGQKRLTKSTLLRKLNAGLYNEVPAELKKWIYAKGKVLGGLVIRRAAECELWEGA